MRFLFRALGPLAPGAGLSDSGKIIIKKLCILRKISMTLGERDTSQKYRQNLFVKYLRHRKSLAVFERLLEMTNFSKYSSDAVTSRLILPEAATAREFTLQHHLVIVQISSELFILSQIRVVNFSVVSDVRRSAESARSSGSS